jgi:hypothetical protein
VIPPRKAGPVDLFGRPIRTRRTRTQIELERHYRETMPGRIARLSYVKRVYPDGGFAMPIESWMSFGCSPAHRATQPVDHPVEPLVAGHSVPGRHLPDRQRRRTAAGTT